MIDPAHNEARKQTVPASGRVLVVDDDPDQCEQIAAALRREGHVVRSATIADQALHLLSSEAFDVAAIDIGLNGITGFELCERVLGTKPDTVVIMITGSGSMTSAIEALRAGALDFLVKPIDGDAVRLAVARALTRRRLKGEIKTLEGIADQPMPQTMIGESSAQRIVSDRISRVSASEGSVLIRGETGTGKELVAKAIHTMGPRRLGPFVAINCAAVPPALLESELFGHVRGAFTDAKAAHQGLFVRANGGTLFLDEIGEMPLELQPKLLRVLQERRVRAVGDDTEVAFDARVVAATNRDLEHEIEAKRFREDLFYRINVITIDLPPLRDRGNDVLLLANHFLARFAQQAGRPGLCFSTGATEKLLHYDWPGNVREMENAIERCAALASASIISATDLPEKIATFTPQTMPIHPADPAGIITMRELERRYLLRVLQLRGGNKSRVAELLGVDRRTLYRKLARYGVGGPHSTPNEA